MRCLACFVVVWFVQPLFADDPSKQQRVLADGIAAKAQRSEVWTDGDGNVTGLILINHQALNERMGERPGVSDTDLAALVNFPQLSALNLEAQSIGDQGLQVLRQFPRMKQVGFHYMAKAEGSSASPDFIMVIDGMQELEIIEIKHNFRMKAINVDKLKGPFPKVWRLVLDTPITAEQTLHLIRLCPNVTDLQLHRSDISGAQLAEIGTILPKLEVLWFKPKRDLTASHLRSLSIFPKLRIFSPQQFKNELAFEDGWDALTACRSLQRLEIEKGPADLNRLALERLSKEMPDLKIEPKLTRSRNYDGL